MSIALFSGDGSCTALTWRVHAFPWRALWLLLLASFCGSSASLLLFPLSLSPLHSPIRLLPSPLSFSFRSPSSFPSLSAVYLSSLFLSSSTILLPCSFASPFSFYPSSLLLFSHPLSYLTITSLLSSLPPLPAPFPLLLHSLHPSSPLLPLSSISSTSFLSSTHLSSPFLPLPPLPLAPPPHPSLPFSLKSKLSVNKYTIVCVFLKIMCLMCIVTFDKRL